MRRALGWGLGIAATLGVRVAVADPGTWVEGGVEVGYLDGDYTLARSDKRLSGQAFVLGGAIGVAPSKLWAIGVGGELTLANTGHEATRGGRIDAAWGTSAGLEVAIRPLGTGLLLRPSVSYERMTFSTSSSSYVLDVSAGGDFPLVEAVRGPRLALALGWSGALIGARVGASYSHLSGEDSTFRPIVIGVGLVFHYWGSR